MKGSFVSRNGHYYAVLEEKDQVTGKRKRKWRTLHGNYKEAIVEFNELVNSKNKGTYVEPSKTTLKTYLETWLQDTAYPNMTPHNYEGYEFQVNKYIIPALGQIGISDLTPANIQKLCAEHQKKGHHRTAQYIYYALNKSLNAALKQGIIVRNPCTGVECPKVPKKEMQTMNEKDMQIFLEYARQGEYYALFYTDLFTGMRRSELLALQWKDINLDPLNSQISVNRTLHFMRYGTYKGQMIFKQPKTAKSRRLISLTPSNAIVLTEHLEARKKFLKSLDAKFDPEKDFNQNELVFCKPDGNPYQPDSVSHAWMKIAKRTGLKGIRLHDARHTHASIMLKQGIHPKIVQERLGHASIETTLDTYSHVAPGLQAAAASAFDNIVTGKENAKKEEISTVRR